MDANHVPSGRVVLVTGASGGIGRVTSEALAAAGDTVVMVSRPTGNGAVAAEEVRQATGGDVHHLPADLALLSEVRALAAAFRERWPRLDALLLNAGAFFGRRRTTSEDIEATWALNHLGTATLAVLLADVLLSSAPARVIVTSSDAANAGRIRWQDPERSRSFSGMGAYAQSKLANQLFTLELARRLDGSGVTVHALTPGFVATGFGAEAGAVTPFFRLAQRLFGRTPERGADSLTFLARDPEALASTGGYWADRRRRPMAPAAREPGAAERLWALTVERAGLTPAELSPLETAGTARQEEQQASDLAAYAG